MRLLEEYIDKSPHLVERLVCAYVVGSRIPLDKFTRTFRALRESTGPLDHTGVVVGWDTLGPNHHLGHDRFLQYPGTWYTSGSFETDAMDEGVAILSTNPITWEPSGRGGRVDGSKWLGMLALDVEMKKTISLLQWCRGGFIGIGNITRTARTYPVPPEDFYVHSK